MNQFQNTDIRKTGWSIGLVSASVIAFQITLLQVFSVTQWYHFAHLIISVALLGFGCSGTVLALFRKRMVKQFSFLFPLLLLLSSASMASAVFLVQQEFFRFDTYLLFTGSGHIVRLLSTCLILMLPIFLAALAIGLTFIRFPGESGKIYFANLTGSGIGGGLALGLMWIATAERLPAIIAVFPFIAGIIFMKQLNSWKWLSALVLFLVLLMNFINPPLVRSQYKSIQKTLTMPDARVIHQRSSPYGLTEVVQAPALRYAPGLSLNYTKAVPARAILFHNGDWLGAVIPAPPGDSLTLLSYTAGALPYAVRQYSNVLILNSGAGENIAMALSYQPAGIEGNQQAGIGRDRRAGIDAVDPNKAVTGLLKKELAAQSDSLLFSPLVRIINQEPRTWLKTTDSVYDLVQLPVVGSFFGTSGLDAFSIRNELTLESFEDIWHRLDENGMISITCWLDYPVRIPLKIMATLSSLMSSQGVEKPEMHLAAVRSWSSLSFLVKKSEFALVESRKILSFCDSLSFDPLFLPGIKSFNREYYNQLDDPWLFEAMDKLISTDADAFVRSYPFRIEPATDNKPYFSQFIRVKSVPRLAELFGNRGVPYLELGYVVVLLGFLILLAVSVILILVPVVVKGQKMIEKTRSFFYFGSIGMGYMFLEMVFIQQFTLFLGQPVYSASAVISILLIASGAGSYLSSRINAVSRTMLSAGLAIAAVLLLYAFLIAPLLSTLMVLPAWSRFLVMAVLVGLPGLLMGIPFPLGLTRLSKVSPQTLPLAWAVNGFASVTGTSLGIILSVEAGFNWVLLAAAAAYGIAAATNH